MLKEIVDEYMQKAPEVKDYCRRCLETKRWGGSVVLMVLDASFTSIGLNYSSFAPFSSHMKGRDI